MAVRYAEEAEVAFSKGGNMYQLRSKKYDIVIKNGTLIDTIGDFEKKEDLAVVAGKIAAIGTISTKDVHQRRGMLCFCRADRLPLSCIPRWRLGELLRRGLCIAKWSDYISGCRLGGLWWLPDILE